MNISNLTKEDLQKDYSTRHGFVFQSPVKSSDNAIETLCDILIHHKITSEHPEHIVRLAENVTAFVYKDDFNGPQFFQKADMATQIGMCVITPLAIYLSN